MKQLDVQLLWKVTDLEEIVGLKQAKAALCALAVMSMATPVLAADILFVDDYDYNSNMPSVLTGDGHSVTAVTGAFDNGHASLLADLSSYDVVVWAASDSGPTAGVIDNLTAYVTAGGRVFFTGFDALISSPDSAAFLGILTSYDDTDSTPGVVVNVENSLTSGYIDIRGVVPFGGYGDYDAAATLAGDTVGVTPAGDGGWAWTLRTLGAGEIAYVSNGGYSLVAHPSWSLEFSGGLGAYNAALRNFAAASGGANPPPLPTTCAVTDHGDGTYTIACPDGSSVTVSDGATGADGVAGPAGADGSDGATGADGVAGPAGADGSDGATGAPGADGADGAAGPAGADGSDGASGTDGAPGSAGTSGADGSSCMAINNDNGTYTISCEDGSSVVLMDGAAGSNGADGDSGESCTVISNGAARATISCGDGTSVTIDAPEASGGCSVAGSPADASSTLATVLGALGLLGARRRRGAR